MFHTKGSPFHRQSLTEIKAVKFHYSQLALVCVFSVYYRSSPCVLGPVEILLYLVCRALSMAADCTGKWAAGGWKVPITFFTLVLQKPALCPYMICASERTSPRCSVRAIRHYIKPTNSRTHVCMFSPLWNVKLQVCLAKLMAVSPIFEGHAQFDIQRTRQ